MGSLPSHPVKQLIRHRLIIWFILLCSIQGFSAIPSFDLNVTKTDETCSGNGSLVFTTSNTQPGASIAIKVYKHPDLVNPIAFPTSGSLTGLTAGSYRVLATQTLAGESNQTYIDITIENLTVPLAYTVTSTPSSCQNNGTLTISVFSGTAALYEIISGPVIAPLQSSNTFSNLPAGVYQIRVFDNCGEGWVATHTLLSTTASLAIAPASFEDEVLPSCNTINVTNNISSTTQGIVYPLQLIYTIFPPGGGSPIVISQVIASGSPSSHDAVITMPFYNNQPYTYNLQITDGCGNIFQENDIVVDVRFSSIFSAPDAECGQHFLTVTSTNYVAPVTINFLAYPSGFDPVQFNVFHPGPFAENPVEYGNGQTPVPIGYYQATVTDACGRTVTIDMTIEDNPIEPSIEFLPYPGCQSDTSEVTFEVPGFSIVSAQVTAGTAGFSNSYPVDVSGFIQNDGTLIIPVMQTGNYTIILIDDCGNEYEEDFFVPAMATSVTSSARTGCEPGKGSLRVRGSSTSLVSAIIIAAPAAFGFPLPYDAIAQLSADGIFSMDELPPGIYQLQVTDNCGISHVVTAEVTAYAITQNDYSITPYCGSFDLTLNHQSNTTVAPGFWLQKKNPVTGTWGHPQTDVVYVDGTMPSALNSYAINNNATNYNISYLGDFRILKVFETFSDGGVGLFQNCFEIIREFTFTNTLSITDITKTTCNGQFSNVQVSVTGVPPYTFQITAQNGQPYFVYNGNANVFLNLEAAVYNFLVMDSCGNVVNQLTDVALLPSLAQASQPGNLVECDDSSGDGSESFMLSSQNIAILGSLNPSDYQITYHLSQADAAAEINPLPLTYISGNATIYARLENLLADGCFDIVSFNLIVLPYLLNSAQETVGLCQNLSITLSASPGLDSYLWSNGATTSSISVSESGQYTVEVTNNGCAALTTFDVVSIVPPEEISIMTHDWTSSENTIEVQHNQNGSAELLYSLDGVNFQQSNVFTGLVAGDYTVFIKDVYGCFLLQHEVYLLNYPHFFTPNGDGFNDYWQVKFVQFEPGIKIFVFDRYGKLLTGFGADSVGWDGTFNGKPLPSTDYWFLVERINGRTHRGHFAMKR